MSPQEIDSLRMKAYLSFDEEEVVRQMGVSDKPYYYKNSKNELIPCHIIFKRDNGEIIVERSNGCRICLMQKDLIEVWKILMRNGIL